MTQPTTHRCYLWIPLQWIAHFADEGAFGFPGWATRHFAPLPAGLWWPGMVVLTVCLSVVGFAARMPKSHRVFPFVAIMFQSIFACNVVFHLTTTFVFGEYSPGTASGVFAMLPATFFVVRRARRDERMVGSRMSAALVTGFVVHALVVASLFVDKSA